MTQLSGLSALEYDEQYYEEHKDANLDYLIKGYWQESYGRMVKDACSMPNEALVVDAGCACGAILQGLKESGLKVFGADLNEYMVNLGKEHFGYSDNEIKACSISGLPLDTESVDLIHSAQVFEHLPESEIDAILKELYRVTKQGGKWFICLDAIKAGETKEMYMGDPTHILIMPTMYWSKKFADLGMVFDRESYDNYVKSPHGPEKDGLNFFNHYPYWSTWTLIKE